MRFAVPDDSDSDSDGYEVVALDPGYTSDESDHVPDLTRTRRTKLGQNIRDMLAFSDSEADSEDEVGELLGGDFQPVSDKTSWRESGHDATRKSRVQAGTPAPRRRSSVMKPRATWGRWDPSLNDLLRERPNECAELIREMEAEAWAEGQLAAGERMQRLREIDERVRAEMRRAQKGRQDTQADELMRMMEGLALRQKQEADDTAKRFAEREAKLWADVDAAIKEAERKQAEEQAARLAEERRKKEEEEAKIKAAEKEALARKAEQERIAKEKSEREAAEKAKKEKEEADAAEKAKKEEAAAREGSRSATEWNHWVDVQKKMKTEVIQVVKGDADLRKALRQGMRVITRSIGQVVNTNETILRVTNDIHGLLTEQLGRAPSVAEPAMFEASFPPAYGYLCSHVSKALIKQAESEVGAKPEAAFPLARIALGLILRGHGAFGTILFARLVKKCPWVIPFYPTRAPNQPREEFEKSTGRGVDESVEDYIARMSGITTFYFAILQMQYPSFVNSLPATPTAEQFQALIIPPFRLPAAWTWLATMLRDPLRGSPPAATLMATCLDITGYALSEWTGPKQIGKLLSAIQTALQAGKIPGDSKAAEARLANVFQQYAALHQPAGSQPQ